MRKKPQDVWSFSEMARRTAYVLGTPTAFLFACATIAVWAVCGPVFGYSDTWQLVINTGTTVVTFLMVFLVQNTQNRDARALHLKLDELLRSVRDARNKLIDLENCSDEEIARIEKQFQGPEKTRRAQARERTRKLTVRCKAMAKGKSEGTLPTHGARVLPSVEVDSYNLEVEDDERLHRRQGEQERVPCHS
jgi:low affinity Fe/Cu permease